MLRSISASAIAVFSAAPLGAQPAADPAFVGHYYLSGVMETGSELLLKPDGRFEWCLVYGALDQFAKGRWERRSSRIVLIADVSANQPPSAPFETMELTIDGKDLLPEGRGRYSRE